VRTMFEYPISFHHQNYSNRTPRTESQPVNGPYRTPLQFCNYNNHACCRLLFAVSVFIWKRFSADFQNVGGNTVRIARKRVEEVRTRAAVN